MPCNAKQLFKVVAAIVVSVVSVASTTVLAAYNQQEALHECSNQAGDRKGSDRKAFMQQCLTDKQPELQEEATKQADGAWWGNWVEGEKGARTYNKVRITADTFARAPGGNSDYFYFMPEKNKIWCKVTYKIASRSHGKTYPDESPDSQDTARRLGRQYEIVLLELEHSKCGGFRYLQMAFPSDINGYADVSFYDEKRRWAGSFNYHQVDR